MLTNLATLLVIGIVGLLTKFLHWYFTKARRIIQMTSNIQSPARHWLWGTLHLLPEVNSSMLDWFRSASEKYGGIFIVWFGPFLPWVSVCRPEFAKDILRTEEPKTNGVPGYGVFEEWIGLGLILSGGDAWRRNRKLLTPSFHFDMLKAYLDMFNKTTDTFICTLDALAKKGESFDIFKPTSLLTLDTILRCVFSVYDDIQNLGESHPVAKLSSEAQSIVLYRWFSPWLWPGFLFYLSPSGRRFRRICNDYKDISRRIIADRKIELLENSEENKSGCKKDFLGTLLVARDEDGCGLTDEEILSEVNTFLFTGHDTTMSAISWTLYSLATHQREQEACREEVRQTLAGRDTDEISSEDLPKMTHLTMCIKETLRQHSIVPAISRQVSRDLQVGDYTLPQGCKVDILLHVIHKDPSVWEDPDEFRPERFNPKNSADRSAFAFVPFSAGPRNCIGQHFAMNLIKVVVARILNRYTVTYDTSHPVKKMPDIVMKTESGLWLSFEKI